MDCPTRPLRSSTEHQRPTLMKNNTIGMPKSWLPSAALGVVLLFAGAGCNCITINIGSSGGNSGTPRIVNETQAGPPAGGNFVPVQAFLSSSGSATVCGQPVSASCAVFYAQTPPAGYGGFQGYLRTVATPTKPSTIIRNTDYYLQWFVNGLNNGCCTPVPGSPNNVACPVTPGLSYLFTAYFKPGALPPPGTAVQLMGAWTLSEVDE